MSEATSIRARVAAAGHALTLAEYSRLAREIAALQPQPELRGVKVALLGSCTLQFLDPFVRVEGVRQRLHLDTYYGPFGQFEQQIHDPVSQLRSFEPGVIVLLMRPEDLNPDIHHRFHATDGRALEEIVDRLDGCVRGIREWTTAPVLVANFAAPAFLPLGPFEANVAGSLTYALADANGTLRERIGAHADAYVWDYAAAVTGAGRDGWTDPRMWALARVPIARDRQRGLAQQLTRTIAALGRPPAKCLVLDLDNTLWGGVIGDDGMTGIQLGDDYPGNVFKSFQRAILGLADRGVLLAVVSKNDENVALQAIREHPEMLIREEHLAAFRIDWEPKSGHLRAIAKELNIGSDALVYFDDNPVERAEVAAHAPEVLIVDAPADPLGFERALYESGFFDAPVISQEDRQRVTMYRQERAREVTRQQAGNVDDFLADLVMEGEVGFVGESTIARVAQLVGKTNQFNLTTRRHSSILLTQMAGAEDHAVLYMRLRDRFGDLGLIAVAIVRFEGTAAVIDSFVMSCRAMGRRAEIALAAEIVRVARERGAKHLVGDYVRTPRNGIVEGLYPGLGFTAAGAIEGGERFTLDLTDATVPWPEAIRRVASPESTRVDEHSIPAL